MKSRVCMLLMALVVSGSAVADSVSRFESILLNIRTYKQELFEFKKAQLDESQSKNHRSPPRPELTDSFWLMSENLSAFSAQEVDKFCRIVEFYAAPRFRAKAQLALERIGNDACRLESRDELYRCEQMARCLHREFGDGSGFERTAVYKKILRKKLSLAGNGK